MFSDLRRRTDASLKEDYNSHISDSEESILQDPKSFWRFVNRGRKQKNEVPNVVNLDGRSSNSTQSAADLFASFFSSVYLDEPFQEPPIEDFYAIRLSELSLTYDDIYLGLVGFKDVVSSGPDDIPQYFLKRCAYSLTYPITLLFNMSLDSGVFPSLWKESFVVPLLKSGDPNCVKNYRPISKINSIAQLFDSIIHNKLSSFFSSVIISEQHGFVKGKSTVTNLLEFTERIHSAFLGNIQVDSIYTDLAKAFDKINHRVLLYKLRCSGISGSLLRWLASYLSNRSQIVRLGGFLSRRFRAPSGVPQGSHLGPLLFVLFINDLRKYLGANVGLSLFADDCKIFLEISSVLDCVLLQEALRRFEDYCGRFHLELNLDKCKVMTFYRSEKNLVKHKYKLGNHSLARVESINDLGVILDAGLNYREHIDHVYRKSLRMLGFVFRTCGDFRSVQTLKVVYYSFVRSHLEYCSQIWNPVRIGMATMIEKVQRKFVRFLYYKKLVLVPEISDFHYHPVLSALSLQTLENRRKCADLILLLKVYFGQISGPSLEQHLRATVTERSLRSQRVLTTQIHSTSSLNRFIRSLNSLPVDVGRLLCGSFGSARGTVLSHVPLFN